MEGKALSLQEMFRAVGKKSADLDLIKNHLGPNEIMPQLMEECGELIQAVNKYRRNLYGKNRANISVVEAEEDLQEEMADVLLLMIMCGLDYDEVAATIYKKTARWKDRLGLE
jgi:NTP pyrophosphatase (non-canonical NTP hydrolase)